MFWSFWNAPNQYRLQYFVYFCCKYNSFFHFLFFFCYVWNLLYFERDKHICPSDWNSVSLTVLHDDVKNGAWLLLIFIENHQRDHLHTSWSCHRTYERNHRCIIPHTLSQWLKVSLYIFYANLSHNISAVFKVDMKEVVDSILNKLLRNVWSSVILWSSPVSWVTHYKSSYVIWFTFF